MTKKRQKNQHENKMMSPTLTKMRDIAWGRETIRAIHRTMDRSERMRDDQGMLEAAEAKRLRKASKLLQHLP